MLNYYRLLDLKKGSSLKEIKESFRKKIKQMHPDLNSDKENKETRMLIEAYKTLSSENSRRNYDRSIELELAEHAKLKESFDYKEYLRSKGDFESFAKLIYIELFQDNDDVALNIYSSLRSVGFRLQEHLEEGDYLECAFLLAEESFRKEEYVIAFEFTKSIMEYETKREYFRLFYEEVCVMMIKIVKKLGKNGLVFLKKELRELLELKMEKKNRTFIARKINSII